MLRTYKLILLLLIFISWTQDASSQELKVLAHSERITSSAYRFSIKMRGTVDGFNSLGLIGYQAPKQAFEPMQFVRLENSGNEDLVNPRLIVNGRNSWFSMQNIVDEALAKFGDPANLSQELKARAIWEFHRKHRFHASAGNIDAHDPVKMYNIYGYSMCGDDWIILAKLWQLAGLETRRLILDGHRVAEVWYGNDWHLMDADLNLIALEYDNQTIASSQELIQDHELVKRTHTYSLTQNDDPLKDQFSAGLYYKTGVKYLKKLSGAATHTMQMRLRPNEALEWRFDHKGKHNYETFPLRETWGDDAWARLSNGSWIYQPDFLNPISENGVFQQDNIRWPKNSSRAGLCLADTNKPGFISWEIAAPYAIVGGSIRLKLNDYTADYSVSISFDNHSWKKIRAQNQSRSDDFLKFNLDVYFPNQGRALHKYYLRLDFNSAGAPNNLVLESLRIENDLQMARQSLPALQLGLNEIIYRSENSNTNALVKFSWSESSANHAPQKVTSAKYPVDGSTVVGSKIKFSWNDAQDSDGDKIIDYNFELCPEANCRYPLSPNFEKLISKTKNKDTASYELPSEGLLNPEFTYYWRVRALDERGVWGDWNRPWSFKIAGPAKVLDTTLEYDGSKAKLSWKANPRGQKPVFYEIYASNEAGFTPALKDYEVFVGNQKNAPIFAGQDKAIFSANLLSKVSETNLEFTPKHLYYRVIALDAANNRSAPSNLLELKAPDLTQTTEQLKQQMNYLGDLSCRSINKVPYNCAFWDAMP